MVDLNILFMDRRGEGLVGAPHTFHMFERAVAKYCNCAWAGEDYKGYVDESVDATVRRVMPEADWVIVDRNKLQRVYARRNYRVGVHVSDLHGKFSHGLHEPREFADLLKKLNYDLYFMKYMEIHGCGCKPSLFTDTLGDKVIHLPWSFDAGKHTWKRKTVDATFIGGVGGVYPIRSDVYKHLKEVAKDYVVVCETSPKGDTYDRQWSNYKDAYVGDKYVELLNRSKVMLFDSSRYKYPVQKYFESAASACITLADIPSTGRELGFVDGETMIEINKETWREKLLHTLENYDMCKNLIRRSLKNAYMNHSHDQRAKQFIRMLVNQG